MIPRLVAWVTQIPVVRFLQVVLALGVTVLLMTRDARPFGLVPGAVIAAVILVPNLVSKQFRLSVWLVALFAGYAILFFTRLLPLTNFSILGACEVGPEDSPITGDWLGYPEMVALVWFGAALATGVLLCFVDRGTSGKLDAGAWRSVVAAGLWLAAAGGVSRSDEILRVPHRASCYCTTHSASFAENVCPDIVTKCAAIESDTNRNSAACTLVVSPLARAGASLGWVLVGAGLLIAAGGAHAGRGRSGPGTVRDGRDRSDDSATDLSKRRAIDSRFLIVAFIVIPFFFLGIQRTLLLEFPHLRDSVTTPIVKWLYKTAGMT